MNRLPVEICLGGVTPVTLRDGLRAARAGGASRVELCSRMSRQGLSPWPWQLRLATAELGGEVELVVMVRPEEGFDASPRLVERLLRELERAAAAGAQGVALGLLRGGMLDLPAMTRLSRVALDLGLTVTCHRAFDAVQDQREALEQLIAMGVRRLLCSGLPWQGDRPAEERHARLAELALRATGRLELVLAGGLSASSAPALLGHLPAHAGPISLHAWSGVRRGGRVQADLVRQMVEVAQRPR